MSNSTDSIFQGSLFAEDDVTKWRDEKARLVKMRQKINLRIQALEQMISGAELYYTIDRKTENETTAAKKDSYFTEEDEGRPAEVNSPPSTMHDAIANIVQRHPKGLEPREIAAAIRADETLSSKIRESHPNYLYTAISRLVVKHRIRKDGTVYKPV